MQLSPVLCKKLQKTGLFFVEKYKRFFSQIIIKSLNYLTYIVPNGTSFCQGAGSQALSLGHILQELTREHDMKNFIFIHIAVIAIYAYQIVNAV